MYSIAYPSLFNPVRVFGADDVTAKPSAAPASPGVYAWYFNEVPPDLCVSGCHQWKGLWLLYVGISPKAPPSDGRAPSRSTLRKRLRTHYSGNAEGSTLRRTLGCLHAARLNIELRRVGSGTRYTFTNPGERSLDAWMRDHAFVTWIETEHPYKAERDILASGVRLPLNIDGNPCAEDVTALSQVRLNARRRADELTIVVDNGGPRRISLIT